MIRRLQTAPQLNQTRRLWVACSRLMIWNRLMAGCPSFWPWLCMLELDHQLAVRSVPPGLSRILVSHAEY